MSNTINVVVWSGGLDSTLVLDQLCSSNRSKCIFEDSRIQGTVIEEV